MNASKRFSVVDRRYLAFGCIRPDALSSYLQCRKIGGRNAEKYPSMKRIYTEDLTGLLSPVYPISGYACAIDQGGTHGLLTQRYHAPSVPSCSGARAGLRPDEQRKPLARVSPRVTLPSAPLPQPPIYLVAWGHSLSASPPNCLLQDSLLS